MAAAEAAAGVALLALGVACWLAREDAGGHAVKGLVAAMLLYNLGSDLCPGADADGLSGIAFWPVVLAHIGLAAWCVTCRSMGAPAVKRS